MLDITKQENKKYIPIATFILGGIVGAVVMHYWIQKKGKKASTQFASGGAIPSTTVQIVQPAPVAQVQPAPFIQAPVISAPAVAHNAGGEAFSTPSM